MQAAWQCAQSKAALAVPAIVHAQYTFNQSRRGAIVFKAAQSALHESHMHRRDWWLIHPQTGFAGCIHCEGSTK